MGSLLILSAALCWSLGGVLNRAIGINPVLCNALRSIIALCPLLIYSRGRVKLNKTVILAGICLFLTCMLFFLALSLTTTANTTVIQYSAPFFVMIFTAVQKRKLPAPVQLMTVAGAFTGVAVIFWGDMDSGRLLGNFVALLSGIAFAGVFFCNKQQGSSPVDSTIVGFALSGLCALFFIGSFPAVNGKGWLLILLLGLVQHGLAYIFFCKGILKTSGLTASLIGMTEIVFAPLWVFLFYREIPKTSAFLGSTLIIVSVVFHAIWENKEKGRIKNNT